MAKPKCSTYLPHIFSTFSSVFLWIFQISKTQTASIRSTDVCKHTGKGKTFYSNEFFIRKNTWISCTASASTDPRLRLCGTQTRLFQWLQRCMMPSVFFVATPERNATATRKEPLCWDGFYLESLNKRLTSSENTARADPTPAVDANLFFKDVQYWKLKPKLKTIITT